MECPSCGALALPAGETTGEDKAFQRALSGIHDMPTSMQSSGISDERTMIFQQNNPLSDAVVDPAGRVGVFSALLSSMPDASEPSAPITTEHTGVGALDDVDQSEEEEVRAPSPSESTEPPASESTEPLENSGARARELDFDFGKEIGDFDLPATNPNIERAIAHAAHKHDNHTGRANLPRVDVQLAELSLPREAPPPALEALTEDAFGQLEQAFANLAVQPVAVAESRGRDGLTENERAFLRADAPPPAARPAAKVAQPKAPPTPPQRRKVRSLDEMVLSREAREAAFLPARGEPAPAGPPPARVRASVPQAPARRGHATSAGEVEPTDVLAERRAVPRREPPAVLSELRVGAAVTLLVVGLLGGAGVGAATAPTPVKQNHTRARAEQSFADGNRYFDEARFEEALGKYKGAINIDHTFAPAHRAKGVALAKLQRYDEAAEAYREYLVLEPDAVDRKDVRESLSARGIKASAPPGDKATSTDKTATDKPPGDAPRSDDKSN